MMGNTVSGKKIICIHLCDSNFFGAPCSYTIVLVQNNSLQIFCVIIFNSKRVINNNYHNCFPYNEILIKGVESSLCLDRKICPNILLNEKKAKCSQDIVLSISFQNKTTYSKDKK